MREGKGREKGELSRVGMIRAGILGEAGPGMTAEAVMETGRVSDRETASGRGSECFGAGPGKGVAGSQSYFPLCLSQQNSLT